MPKLCLDCGLPTAGMRCRPCSVLARTKAERVQKTCVDCPNLLPLTTAGVRCRVCAARQRAKDFHKFRGIVLLKSPVFIPERAYSAYCPDGQPHQYVLGLGTAGGQCKLCREVYSSDRVRAGIGAEWIAAGESITLSQTVKSDMFGGVNGVNVW